MWRELVVDLAPATEINPPATADITRLDADVRHQLAWMHRPVECGRR
jgi:hypothetical protein